MTAEVLRFSDYERLARPDAERPEGKLIDLEDERFARTYAAYRDFPKVAQLFPPPDWSQ